MLDQILGALNRSIFRWSLVGLLALGCDSAGGYAPCVSNDECSSGRICLQGECVDQPNCGNGQCEMYKNENCFTCAQDCGKCKELGDICSTDEDCFNGKGESYCLKYGFESTFYNGKGVCSKDCYSENCPSRYVCHIFDIDNGKTVHQCEPETGESGELIAFHSSEEPCQYFDYPTIPRRNFSCSGTKLIECNEEGKVNYIDCAEFGFSCIDKLQISFNPGCYGLSKEGGVCLGDIDCLSLGKNHICSPKFHESVEKVCLPESCNQSLFCPEGYYCNCTDFYPCDNYVGINTCTLITTPCVSDGDCPSENCGGKDGHRYCLPTCDDYWGGGCPDFYYCKDDRCVVNNDICQTGADCNKQYPSGSCIMSTTPYHCHYD